MSDHEEMLSLLRGVQFLHDIDDQYLRAIAPIAEVLELPADAVLFRRCESHPTIYLVLEGSVALEIWVPGQEADRLQTVGEGELLGWSPLLGLVVMTATARTLTPTRVVAINAPQLLLLCECNPRLGFEFMRRAAQALALRLNAMRMQLIDLSGREPSVVPAVAED